MLSDKCEPVCSSYFLGCALGREKLAPFQKGGGSEVFESGFALNVSLMIEVIMD